VILKSNTATPQECLEYALNLPTSVVITGIDSDEILDQAFQVASNFKPLSAQQVAAILAKSKDAAARGEYELFKTSAHFDSTAKHPEWLGGETPQVQKLGARHSFQGRSPRRDHFSGVYVPCTTESRDGSAAPFFAFLPNARKRACN
jgi:hypothetical protein